MNKDYQQLLEQLHNGEIEEFTVEANEFIEFQTIFHEFEFRKKIKGTAMRGGQIIYRTLDE